MTKYKIDIFELAHQAINRQGISSFVRNLLPGGKKQGNEWVVKNPTRNDDNAGSFSANLVTGKWGEFSPKNNSRQGNDCISLYAYVKGISNLDAACEIAGVDPRIKDTHYQ